MCPSRQSTPPTPQKRLARATKFPEEPKFAAFEARITETSAVETREADLRELSRLFLPAIQAFPERIDEADVRRQLLVLAIKVQRQGAEAIRGSTIPGHGPVEYRATDTGFELRCQPGSTDKPVVLQVGHAPR